MLAPDPGQMSDDGVADHDAKQLRHDVTTDSPAATTAVDPATFPGVNVLLAEDNVITQEIASHMLTSLALDVTPALDGLEAVAAFESGGHFDLVLMDIQMPYLNGYEATGRIRDVERRRGWGRTPIIALTAFAMPGDREKCLAADMDDYVVKPYGREAIVHLLRRWAMPGAAVRNGAAPQSTMPDVEPHSPQPVSDLTLDDKRIRDLKSVMGDAFPSLITSIADALLANAQLVQQAIDSKDVPAVLSAAHKLKNTAGEIGAGQLRAVATQFEQAARVGQLLPLGDLPEYVRQVSDAVRDLR
jgi:CheY-like chemotaxis protein